MKSSSTSERLKQIMKERNLKQVDILEACQPYCEKYGVKLKKNDLSQYISGKVTPKQNKLSILSMALNINEVWLMGYDVPKKKDREFVNMENKKFAQKLKQARINAGLTQKAVYEKLGLAQSTFSSWETGKSEPDANTLITLCSMYGITNLNYFSDSTINVNESDKQTHDKLQSLSPENREKALEYIQLLNMLETKQEIEKDNIIDFKKEA